jgi:adenine-specific DNA glycosylase
MNVKVKEHIGTFRQTYSHFKLTLHAYHCQAAPKSQKRRWVPIRNLHLLPMSKIHRRIATILQSNGMSLRAE